MRRTLGMGWMLFVLGLMVGGAMGVTAMAVVFYARGGEAQANFSGRCTPDLPS